MATECVLADSGWRESKEGKKKNTKGVLTSLPRYGVGTCLGNPKIENLIWAGPNDSNVLL